MTSETSISTETLKSLKVLYSLSKEQKPKELRALMNLFKNELKDVGIVNRNLYNMILVRNVNDNFPHVNEISQRVQYTHLLSKISDNSEKEFYIPISQFEDKYIRIGINININLLANTMEDCPFKSDKNGLCLVGNTLFLMPLKNETYIIRNSKLYYSKNKKYIFLHPESKQPVYIYSVPI
jgi:hypothetical protein